MKTFQKLKLKGNKDIISIQFEKIIENFHSGWSHNIERENEVKRDVVSIRGMYCFYCPETQFHPSANIWFAESESGEWYNSNIVPDRVSKLDYDKYNCILNEFNDEYVVPYMTDQDISITFTSAEISMEDIVDSEIEKTLKTFSSAANKTVLHPLDQERWYDFVIAAHRKNIDLDPDYLERWLREDEHWGDDRAYELAADYETLRIFLKYYDRRR
jgi:hypothetical protein